MQRFYDFNAIDIEGTPLSMSKYRGKVVLVVNVASKCTFTSQYEELQKLYASYSQKGLEILAFPCNQFKEQELGSNQEIESFCSVNYGITFPLFQKIDVNGTKTHALYQFLKKEVKGFLGTESIKWNFTKFLIDRDGNVVKRYASITNPKEIKEDIEELLKEFIINVE